MGELGMAIHPRKSVCHTSSGSRPPGERAGRLWDNAARHDGFVLCGPPFSAEAEPSTLAEYQGLVPRGSPAFVGAFLKDVAANTEAYMRRLIEVPKGCTPGAQASSAPTPC